LVLYPYNVMEQNGLICKWDLTELGILFQEHTFEGFALKISKSRLNRLQANKEYEVTAECTLASTTAYTGYKFSADK